jgi:hypothetical protein
LSTLGKILTVLVVLVAIGLAVLVPTLVRMQKNWKEAYDQEHQLFLKAIDQREQAIQQRDKEYLGWQTDRSKLDQRINNLTTEVNLRNNTITTLRNEKENQEKRLQELVEQVKGLNDSLAKEVAQRDAWRKERDEAMAAKDQLETMLSQLDAKYRASVDDNQRLKEDLLQAKERIDALESRIAYYEQQPGLEKPKEVPAVPPQKIKGLITSADNEARVAEINLGSDDGVVQGMKFFIYNENQNKYLATLLVTRVSTNSAAGELSVIRGDVKVNDHVTNRFE